MVEVIRRQVAHVDGKWAGVHNMKGGKMIYHMRKLEKVRKVPAVWQLCPQSSRDNRGQNQSDRIESPFWSSFKEGVIKGTRVIRDRNGGNGLVHNMKGWSNICPGIWHKTGRKKFESAPWEGQLNS